MTYGRNAIAVATGDFNGDSWPDLVVPHYATNTTSILLGNNDGTFTNQPTFETGANPFNVTVGDFDDDGLLDIAIIDATEATISILFGYGNGSFTPRIILATGTDTVSIATGDTVLLIEAVPAVVVTGDFNGDSQLDIASAGGNYLEILIGYGNGTFRREAFINSNLYGYNLATGDFNADSKLDVMIVDIYNDQFGILLGLGNGSFAAPVIFTNDNYRYRVALADFNNDGLTDIAVAHLLNDGVDITLNTCSCCISQKV